MTSASEERTRVIADLASAVAAVERPHPVRVAVDGVGVAGKTVLADELVAPLERMGRPVIRAGIDGFHRPRSERYRRGPDSPEGYLSDSFDHAAVIESVLAPLGPGGDLEYRAAAFDFRTDRPVEAETRTAPSNAILLFDGVFLLMPGLREHWDFTIFVHAAFEMTLARALVRDLPLFGSRTAVLRRYRDRYIPGETLYLDRFAPRALADVVVLNDDPTAPALEWRASRLPTLERPRGDR